VTAIPHRFTLLDVSRRRFARQSLLLAEPGVYKRKPPESHLNSLR
jgi:hypothetical protein